MEETKSLQPVDSSSLDMKSNDLVQQIVDETDSDKLKDLTGLFNLNQTKKNLVRAAKFGILLDQIAEQMAERVAANPGQFSNKDLLDYLQAIQNATAKASVYTEEIQSAPQFIQQNNQVNINVQETFDRASKERIADVVKLILQQAKNPPEVIEVSDENTDVKD